MDETDIKILNHLQKHGRAQRNTIAKIVHLSVPSVSERMRKLEEKGLIENYNAILDSKKSTSTLQLSSLLKLTDRSVIPVLWNMLPNIPKYSSATQ